MFRNLLARLPSNHQEFDPLFKDDLFPPGLPPSAVLYWAYSSNIRYAEEEDAAPQDRDYCRLVTEIFPDSDYELPADPTPRQFVMMRAAYACCFERSPIFMAALQNVRDPWFAKLLVDTRLRLLPEHAAHCAAIKARSAHYARMPECLETPLGPIYIQDSQR